MILDDRSDVLILGALIEHGPEVASEDFVYARPATGPIGARAPPMSWSGRGLLGRDLAISVDDSIIMGLM